MRIVLKKVAAKGLKSLRLPVEDAEQQVLVVQEEALSLQVNK
jgi:hypothetical protein